MEIQKELDFKFKAKKVPKNTFYKIYQRLLEENEVKK